jgi:hypothetical protein
MIMADPSERSAERLVSRADAAREADPDFGAEIPPLTFGETDVRIEKAPTMAAVDARAAALAACCRELGAAAMPIAVAGLRHRAERAAAAARAAVDDAARLCPSGHLEDTLAPADVTRGMQDGAATRVGDAVRAMWRAHREFGELHAGGCRAAFEAAERGLAAEVRQLAESLGVRYDGRPVLYFDPARLRWRPAVCWRVPPGPLADLLVSDTPAAFALAAAPGVFVHRRADVAGQPDGVGLMVPARPHYEPGCRCGFVGMVIEPDGAEEFRHAAHATPDSAAGVLGAADLPTYGAVPAAPAHPDPAPPCGCGGAPADRDDNAAIQALAEAMLRGP